MGVTFFEILQPVIDNNISFAASQLGLSINDVYQKIVDEAQRNQKEWYSNRVPNLNYHSQICRLAYLYIVAAANANTFKEVLTKNDDLRNFIVRTAKERSELKICALGAGPGTELLGLAKFFHEQQLGLNVSVDFHLLDKVKEWASSWYSIRDEVLNAYRATYGAHRAKWPMIPSGNLIESDVTDLKQLPKLGNVWNQDLYVVNFLLSEIFDDEPGLRAFIKEIASYAPKGAKFLFIERKGPRWANQMSMIACDANLHLSPFSELSRKLDDNEKPENLGQIYSSIGRSRSPRTSFNVIYSIGTKR